jgi:hypothetical protein
MPEDTWPEDTPNNESKDSSRRISRRAVLKIVAGSTGLSVHLPVLKGTSAVCPAHAVPLGRDSSGSAAFSPKFFSAGQLETLAAVVETIIPTDEHSPGARAARVHEFIDTIVADSPAETRKLWTEGLASLDSMAREQYGSPFARCIPDQQTELLQKTSVHEDHPVTLEERFFHAVKSATVDGYYTSQIGIHQDLQYQGNTALAEFPGCTHEAHQKS